MCGVGFGHHSLLCWASGKGRPAGAAVPTLSSVGDAPYPRTPVFGHSTHGDQVPWGQQQHFGLGCSVHANKKAVQVGQCEAQGGPDHNRATVVRAVGQPEGKDPELRGDCTAQKTQQRLKLQPLALLKREMAKHGPSRTMDQW